MIPEHRPKNHLNRGSPGDDERGSNESLAKAIEYKARVSFSHVDVAPHHERRSASRSLNRHRLSCQYSIWYRIWKKRVSLFNLQTTSSLGSIRFRGGQPLVYQEYRYLFADTANDANVFHKLDCICKLRGIQIDKNNIYLPDIHAISYKSSKKAWIVYFGDEFSASLVFVLWIRTGVLIPGLQLTQPRPLGERMTRSGHTRDNILGLMNRHYRSRG